MTQFGTPARRMSGEIDVYTGLLAVAALVLMAGIAIVAMENVEHSKTSDSDQGGPIKLITSR